MVNRITFFSNKKQLRVNASRHLEFLLNKTINYVFRMLKSNSGVRVLSTLFKPSLNFIFKAIVL